MIYAGANDSSRVPPGWNAWLRGTIDELPDKALAAAAQVRAGAGSQPDRDHGRLSPGGSLGSGRSARPRPAIMRRGSPTRRDARSPLRCPGAARARRRAGRATSRPSGNQPITIDVPRPAAEQPGVTPMAQRVAVLGLLNKRNGIVRDLTLKPGQAMRVKDVTVRLRACEATAPWEAGEADRRLRPGRRAAARRPMGAAFSRAGSTRKARRSTWSRTRSTTSGPRAAR